MTAQYFHAPVGHVAGRDVVVQGATVDDWHAFRAQHRAELIARQHQHAAMRDAVARRRASNLFVWWAYTGAALLLAGIWTGVLVHLGAMACLWLLAFGVGLPLLLKQPLDAACDRQWAEHNAAIADINHALNVL